MNSPYYRAVCPRYCAISLITALYLGLGNCPDVWAAQAPAAETRPAPAPLPSEEAWRVELPSPPSAAGTLDSEYLYVPLESGSLVALQRSSGATAWTHETGTAWPLVPAAGALFVATDTAIIELDRTTGRMSRRIPLGAAPSGPIAVAPRHLLTVIAPATLVAVRLDDRAVVWQRPLGGAVTGIRTGPDGVAYLSLADARIVAVSVADGDVRWTTSLAGVLTEPVTAPGRVFVGSTDNVFYALDAADGRLAWSWATGGDVVGGAADDETVYVVSLDNVVRALNRGNGNQRWHQVMPTRPIAAPQVHNRLLVVPGVAPAISAYDAATGTAAGTFSLGDDAERGVLEGPPLLVTDSDPAAVTAVVLTRDGRAIGLRAAATPEPPPDPPEEPRVK